MLRRAAARIALAAALAIALAMPSRPARAQSITPDEHARLMRGETIRRVETIERGDRRYVGGVTYTVIEATPAELDATLEDVGTYREILPRTKAASVVGRDGDDLLVALRQGTSLMEAAYTIRLGRVASGAGGVHQIRFWLDPSRPHGIDDAWGFFRYEPLAQVSPGVPRVLLTYGVLVDIGPGLVRELFEERIRALVLSVPQRVRDYVWRAIRAGAPARSRVARSGALRYPPH